MPYLAIFGVCGLAGVQWLYFLSIHRMSVGIALLIEYLGPLLVALWVRFVRKQDVRRRVWVALFLSVTGLTMIVGNGDANGVSKIGLLFASISAFTYAIYLLLAEHGAGKRDPISLLAYGFSFATIFWFVLASGLSSLRHGTSRLRMPRVMSSCLAGSQAIARQSGR